MPTKSMSKAAIQMTVCSCRDTYYYIMCTANIAKIRNRGIYIRKKGIASYRIIPYLCIGNENDNDI